MKYWQINAAMTKLAESYLSAEERESMENLEDWKDIQDNPERDEMEAWEDRLATFRGEY